MQFEVTDIYCCVIDFLVTVTPSSLSKSSEVIKYFPRLGWKTDV